MLDVKMATGKYTGTGAALSAACQFRPRHIVLWNETDGTERFEYIGDSEVANSLARGKAYQSIDSGVGTTDLSVLASNGFTVGNLGFTVGTSLSTNAKVYRWVAYGY